MKKVQFNLNGRTTFVGGHGPKVQKVIDFIKAIPGDRHYDAAGIAECIKSTQGAVDQATNKAQQDLIGYFLIMPNPDGAGRKKIFGSKKGIAKLQKDLRAADII